MAVFGEIAWVTRTWALYVVATVLNFATLLISAFVCAAHVLVMAASVLRLRRTGGPWQARGRRLVGVVGACALLGFQLYAAALPQMYVTVWRRRSHQPSRD